MRKTTVGIGLAVLALAVCVLSLTRAPRRPSDHFAVSGREPAFATPAPPGGTVRVNSADLTELIGLPGIGETLAQEILNERAAHGPFLYPEDLRSVRGIGAAKLEDIRPYLDLSEGE